MPAAKPSKSATKALKTRVPLKPRRERLKSKPKSMQASKELRQPIGHLGPNIRRLREARDMTQLALAHQIGLHGNDAGAFISRVEAGLQEPRLDNLSLIAQALGVGIAELITSKI